MSLSSRGLDAAKTIDDFVGVPLARWLPRRPRPLPERPSDVLVVRLWGLGNLALFAPLASSFTGRRLRLLTLERNVPFVASQLPGVEPLTVPAPYSPRFVPAVLRLARRLRREPPEVVVDLEQFLRLPLVLLRGSCAAPVVGLATPGQQREPLLDRAVRYDPTRHVSLTFAALWHAAGLSGTPRPGTLDARPSLCDGLGLPRGRPLVVIHPGSGDHFPGRRWSPERYGRLGARLARRTGAVVVVTGTPGERALVERVVRASGHTAVGLAGRLSIDELLSLLAAADLLVTNDTGPLHMADGLGTPSVALYGPNTPHRYGPRHPDARALFADLPCSPCLDDRTMKRSSCRHFACMDALSEEDVARTAERVLARRRAGTASRPEPHRAVTR